MNFDYFLQSLSNVKIIPLLLAAILIIPVVACKAFRWQQLLKGDYINLNIKTCIRLYFEGYAFGTVTPGQIGEFVKIQGVKLIKNNSNTQKIFRSILIDKIYDISSLSIFCIPALIINTSLNVPMGIIVIYTVINFIILYNPYLLFLVIKKKHWYRRGRISYLITSLFVTIIVIIRGVLIFMAFSIPVGIIQIIIYFPIASLISLMPVSISGFGTREAILIYFFSNELVTEESIVAVGLTIGCIFFLMNGIIGSLILSVNKVAIKN